MQTFLPYRNFLRSAQCLDFRRLGKQRVEAWQILKNITGQQDRWKNHPAVKMWVGYEGALRLYGAIMCLEWKRRGYKDNMLSRFQDIASSSVLCQPPEWITDEFCRSHQSNLVRKLSEHYTKFFPDVPNDLPYIWPK